MTQILLKARPTAEQLADRLAEPRPAGLELYLDRLDLTGATWLSTIAEVTAAAGGPGPLTWIVEAPIRTLGGQYFDLTNDDADHRETIGRVIRVGETIGAVAANIHVVAPTRDPQTLTPSGRDQKLDGCTALLHYYTQRCAAAGLVPQIENIPPVGRMRERAFVYSAIGAVPADLLALAQRFPTIRFTVDTSHAGLSVNWIANRGGRSEREADSDFPRIQAFLQQNEPTADLGEFCRRLAARTRTVHVSNARGWLGEGMAYDDGDFDLDAVVSGFIGKAAYLVTETLEADPNRAIGMREVQTRLERLAVRVQPSQGPAEDSGAGAVR